MIQKARLPLQIRIQMIHNQAIDEKVLEYYDDVDLRREGGRPAYDKNLLTTEIGNLNRIATHQDYQRLLNNSLITPDDITKLEATNKARGLADKITKVEVDRAIKNLDHIEKVLGEVDIQIDVYKNLVDKLPRQVSRLDILEKAAAKGENFRGRKYSVKELGRLSSDLEGYKDNREKLDQALMENEQVQREGGSPLKSQKVWIWSGYTNTRHMGMTNHDPIGLYEKFTVVNDVTGDTDYLEFPRDIEGDMNNCSNICNCQCEFTIE